MNRPPDDWDDEERRTLDELGLELDELRARHRDDPPLDLLRAAGAGALPDALQASVSAHLDRTEWSRALVEGADAAGASVDEVGRRRVLNAIEHAAGRRSVTTWRRKLWLPAIVAAAAILVAVAVTRRGVPATPAERPTSVTAREDPGARPAPPPGFALPLEKPDLKLTAMALVLRGEGRDTPFVDDIAPAVDAYRRGDYREAERRLTRLQSRYPRSVEVPFYRGISRLLLDDAPAAIPLLQAARRLDDETFAPDIAWYLAVAHERAGDVAAARAELAALCGRPTAYGARACEAVRAFATK